MDYLALPEDLILTAFCYENDADMDALKNATFLADNENEENARTHFLSHDMDEILDDKDKQITVMGFQHKHLPLWGIQFHLESVSTEYGIEMMTNFQNETLKWMKKVPCNDRMFEFIY